MKKFIAVALVLSVLLVLGACGSSDGSSSGGSSGSSSSSTSMSNSNVTVEGVYVDSSYVDDDSSSLKMVYVFLNVNATEENLRVDSQYTKLVINGSNSYDSTFYKGNCDYAPSYYYSSFIEDVYVGENIKLALTFKVPEGDLTGSKTIEFEETNFPVDDISFTTDDIVFCDSPEEICEKADPTGYAETKDKFNPADEATVSAVKEQINGYYWTFYVSVGTTVQKHEIEFWDSNNFEVRSSFGANGGTYEVTKGYICVTYSTNNETYNIPYEFDENGEILLDCEAAFNIYE